MIAEEPMRAFREGLYIPARNQEVSFTAKHRRPRKRRLGARAHAGPGSGRNKPKEGAPTTRLLSHQSGEQAVPREA